MLILSAVIHTQPFPLKTFPPQVIFHFFFCDSFGLERIPREHFPLCGPLKAATAPLDRGGRSGRRPLVFSCVARSLLVPLFCHFRIAAFCLWPRMLCFVFQEFPSKFRLLKERRPVPGGNSAADVACVGLKKEMCFIFRRLLILLIESLL